MPYDRLSEFLEGDEKFANNQLQINKVDDIMSYIKAREYDDSG